MFVLFHVRVVSEMEFHAKSETTCDIRDSSTRFPKKVYTIRPEPVVRTHNADAYVLPKLCASYVFRLIFQ